MTFTPHIQPSQNDEEETSARTDRDAVVALAERAKRVGSQAGCGGGRGGVAGRVG